jgi:probable DNA metabolism protein
MVIFLCENSVDGIFTGVYDAWASRLGHENVALRVQGVMDLELFAEYREVPCDSEKAEKVARSIREKMGMDAYQTIYQAALSARAERADCIYRVVVHGMSPEVTRHTARNVIWNLQDPNVSRVFELSRETGNEAHRYIQFVRFCELDQGLLFSEIQAENQVLPLLGDHFADRFPNENFMIYDNGHNDCLIHRKSSAWFILRDAQPSEQGKLRESSTEQEMAQLWRGFCSSIAIKERENRRLQQQFLPLKYRRWMTEG